VAFVVVLSEPVDPDADDGAAPIARPPNKQLKLTKPGQLRSFAA
jgi:hypothetical protein